MPRRRSCTAALMSVRRSIATGDDYTYRPGYVARALRCVLREALSPQQRRRLAACMQRRLARVESMEREQLWLRQHGSPLRAMGLPDHASLTEVRARYRSLLVETHPDTAVTPVADTIAGGLSVSAMPVASTRGSSVHAAPLSREDGYALLRSAYDMATRPDSLWHRNGSAPELYRELVDGSDTAGDCAMRKHRCGSVADEDRSEAFAVAMLRRRLLLLRRVEATRLFALATYAGMLLAVALVVAYVLPRLLELLLELFDSEFYAFMIAQEEKERLLREQGMPVDTDPKRLAPTVLQKLVRPGRYIHTSTV